MPDKLDEIKSYRETFDPFGDSRWPEEYTDWLIVEVELLRVFADAFKHYDKLLQSWGQRLDAGNQHIGDDPELDEAYAAILEALGVAEFARTMGD